MQYNNRLSSSEMHSSAATSSQASTSQPYVVFLACPLKADFAYWMFPIVLLLQLEEWCSFFCSSLGRVFLWRFKSGYGISIQKSDISNLISRYGIHISYLDMRYDRSRFGDYENVPQGLFRYAIGITQPRIVYISYPDMGYVSHIAIWDLRYCFSRLKSHILIWNVIEKRGLNHSANFIFGHFRTLARCNARKCLKIPRVFWSWDRFM